MFELVSLTILSGVRGVLENHNAVNSAPYFLYHSDTTPLISTANITMQFGSEPLFENISAKFGNGHRYGLIGANGAVGVFKSNNNNRAGDPFGYIGGFIANPPSAGN